MSVSRLFGLADFLLWSRLLVSLSTNGWPEADRSPWMQVESDSFRMATGAKTMRLWCFEENYRESVDRANLRLARSLCFFFFLLPGVRIRQLCVWNRARGAEGWNTRRVSGVTFFWDADCSCDGGVRPQPQDFFASSQSEVAPLVHFFFWAKKTLLFKKKRGVGMCDVQPFARSFQTRIHTCRAIALRVDSIRKGIDAIGYCIVDGNSHDPECPT